MKCPFCGHPETEVKDSRQKTGGTIIRRRRTCLGCGQKFTTYERYESAELRDIRPVLKQVSQLKDKCEKIINDNSTDPTAQGQGSCAYTQ